RKQWDTLRQQRHARFDQWRDILEQQWHEPPSTLMEVTSTVWDLRQQLTGGLTETIIAHVHRGEHERHKVPCPKCNRVLQAREPGCRSGDTMVGSVQLERPYFYCRACRCGMSPLDEILGLRPGRLQLDVQQAMADLVTEVPYDTAAPLFSRLSGMTVSSERMHTLTNQAAEGLTVLDVAPSRDEIAQWVTELAAGRWRRPVLVLGIDGAYVPSRPDSARGRRPGQAHQRARRARWQHEWRDAKGLRFYLLDGKR